MKKSILLIFILATIVNPTITEAQNFSPNSNKNFVDSTLKTIGATTATCLTTTAINKLVSKAGDAIEKEAKASITQNAALQSAVGAVPIVGGFLKGFMESSSEQPVMDKKTQELLKRLTTKEDCWDGIATGLAKTALQQVTNQTIAWVNTGLDGNPTYIRDINSFLYSVRNKQLTNILPEIQTNDPIFGNTLRGVLTKQITGKNISVPTSIKQTPEAVKYADFMDDFTTEGWSGLLNSNYNPLSSFFSAVNNISGRLGNEAKNTREEIGRNSGFLDIKECVEQKKQDPDSKEPPTCLRYATTHPGSLIASQIARIYESPISQIEQVDEINEVVYMFFYNFLDKTFKKNAAGKSGLFYSSFDKDIEGLGGTHLGSNVIFDANGKALFAGGSDLSLTKGFQNVDISRPQELREAIETQIDFIAATRDVLVVAADIRPELAQLDYCMPGPNPGWSNYSDKGSLPENFVSMADETRQWWETMQNRWVSFSESYTTLDQTWANTETQRTTAFITNFIITDKTTKETYQLKLDNLVRDLLRPAIEIKFPRGREVGKNYTTQYAIINPNAIPGFGNRLVLPDNKNSFGYLGKIINELAAGKPVIPFFFDHSLKNEDTFIQWMADVVDRLINDLLTTYSKDSVIAAFGTVGATPREQIINRGNAGTAYRETEGLMSYMESYNEIIPLYSDYITDTESLLSELELIHRETEKIVKDAKARYIRQRAAIGDPVDMACIDTAYVINEAPYAKADRFERGAIDANPKIRQMNNARKVFEEVALIKSEVEKTEREITRNDSIDNSRYNDRSNETDTAGSNPDRGRSN